MYTTGTYSPRGASSDELPPALAKLYKTNGRYRGRNGGHDTNSASKNSASKNRNAPMLPSLATPVRTLSGANGSSGNVVPTLAGSRAVGMNTYNNINNNNNSAYGSAARPSTAPGKSRYSAAAAAPYSGGNSLTPGNAPSRVPVRPSTAAVVTGNSNSRRGGGGRPAGAAQPAALPYYATADSYPVSSAPTAAAAAGYTTPPRQGRPPSQRALAAPYPPRAADEANSRAGGDGGGGVDPVIAAEKLDELRSEVEMLKRRLQEHETACSLSAPNSRASSQHASRSSPQLFPVGPTGSGGGSNAANPYFTSVSSTGNLNSNNNNNNNNNNNTSFNNVSVSSQALSESKHLRNVHNRLVVTPKASRPSATGDHNPYPSYADSRSRQMPPQTSAAARTPLALSAHMIAQPEEEPEDEAYDGSGYAHNDDANDEAAAAAVARHAAITPVSQGMLDRARDRVFVEGADGRPTTSLSPSRDANLLGVDDRNDGYGDDGDGMYEHHHRNNAEHKQPDARDGSAGRNLADYLWNETDDGETPTNDNNDKEDGREEEEMEERYSDYLQPLYASGTHAANLFAAEPYPDYSRDVHTEKLPLLTYHQSALPSPHSRAASANGNSNNRRRSSLGNPSAAANGNESNSRGRSTSLSGGPTRYNPTSPSQRRPGSGNSRNSGGGDGGGDGVEEGEAPAPPVLYVRSSLSAENYADFNDFLGDNDGANGFVNNDNRSASSGGVISPKNSADAARAISPTGGKKYRKGSLFTYSCVDGDVIAKTAGEDEEEDGEGGYDSDEEESGAPREIVDLDAFEGTAAGHDDGDGDDGSPSYTFPQQDVGEDEEGAEEEGRRGSGQRLSDVAAATVPYNVFTPNKPRGPRNSGSNGGVNGGEAPGESPVPVAPQRQSLVSNPRPSASSSRPPVAPRTASTSAGPAGNEIDNTNGEDAAPGTRLDDYYRRASSVVSNNNGAVQPRRSTTTINTDANEGDTGAWWPYRVKDNYRSARAQSLRDSLAGLRRPNTAAGGGGAITDGNSSDGGLNSSPPGNVNDRTQYNNDDDQQRQQQQQEMSPYARPSTARESVSTARGGVGSASAAAGGEDNNNFYSVRSSAARRRSSQPPDFHQRSLSAMQGPVLETF